MNLAVASHSLDPQESYSGAAPAKQDLGEAIATFLTQSERYKKELTDPLIYNSVNIGTISTVTSFNPRPEPYSVSELQRLNGQLAFPWEYPNRVGISIDLMMFNPTREPSKS